MKPNRTHGDYVWWGFWMCLIAIGMFASIYEVLEHATPAELVRVIFTVVFFIILLCMIIYASGWLSVFIYDGVREWRDTND